MITYNWKIFEISKEAKSVKYLLIATDGVNTVESEGNHIFSDGSVNKLFSEIVEQDLINWLNNDHVEDDINGIKQNLINQLKELEINKKVEFPWLANTFTI
jgi:hypothetical protein